MVDVTKCPVPDEFLCPISYGIMTNPVILSDGHTYDKSSLKYIKHSKSPISKLQVNIKNPVPNLLIKNLIDNFVRENQIVIGKKTNNIKKKKKRLTSNQSKENQIEKQIAKQLAENFKRISNSRPAWKF